MVVDKGGDGSSSGGRGGKVARRRRRNCRRGCHIVGKAQISGQRSTSGLSQHRGIEASAVVVLIHPPTPAISEHPLISAHRFVLNAVQFVVDVVVTEVPTVPHHTVAVAEENTNVRLTGSLGDQLVVEVIDVPVRVGEVVVKAAACSVSEGGHLIVVVGGCCWVWFKRVRQPDAETHTQ